MSVLRLHLLSVVVAMPLAAHAQTFHELESVTTMAPAAEFLKIAMTAQEICNVARRQKNLPPQAPPATPTPYVHERLWTVGNGRDFVLRRRSFTLGPVEGGDLDCRWAYTWSEQTVIQRGGTTTRIFRTSDGVREIERNAFSAPWSLDPVDSHPLRANAMGLALRCATPESLRQAGILRPMVGMSEICIPEAPLFRDEDGFNLVVQSTANASIFGGKGGEFRALQRVTRYGTYNATDRTWNPQTYLSD
jgi:hypothetical protein